MKEIVRVLIVDDSAYVRKVIKEILSKNPFIEVVGIAHDGEEALELSEELKPDVITLDLTMPEMNGIEFVRQQMARFPIPIVIVSIAGQNTAKVLAALDAGAVDFIQKPTALATEKIFDIHEELIAKVKAAAKIPLSRLPKIKNTVSCPYLKRKAIATSSQIDLIVIGISTGGPQALSYLIPQLPLEFPVPVAIVLHMPVGYTQLYAERLNHLCALNVKEATEGEIVAPGKVLIARAGRHLTFVKKFDGQVVTHLDARPFDTLHRPSVDVMFESAAQVYRDRVLGVIMTGMGSDGKEGAAWIKSQGGTIFTEAEETCVVYGMPRAVKEAGLSDSQFRLDEMAHAILKRL